MEQRIQPSRRNRAPTLPGFLHASTALRMLSRYAAEKRRRWTVAGTSGSGARAEDVVTGSGSPVALRAPSTPGPATTSIFTASGLQRHLSNLSRPYTDLNRFSCRAQIIGTAAIRARLGDDPRVDRQRDVHEHTVRVHRIRVNTAAVHTAPGAHTTRLYSIRGAMQTCRAGFANSSCRAKRSRQGRLVVPRSFI